MSGKVIHEFKCDQRRSAFTRTEQGEYCSACKTVVIDFTDKTNSEIIEILKANNGKVCGSVLRGQLEEDESSFGFRNKVAMTGLAVLLGMGAEKVQAETKDSIPTEIVVQQYGVSSYTQSTIAESNSPAIETPGKEDKKKKERKRKTFMRIGALHFYVQNVFPYVGARRIVKGRYRHI